MLPRARHSNRSKRYWTISTTSFIVSKIGDNIWAWLVAQSYEETNKIQKDYSTLDKSGMWTFLAVVASNWWRIETTDHINFLQGEILKLILWIHLEAEVVLIYNLNDAVRQFFNSVKEALLLVQSIPSWSCYFYYYKSSNLCVIIVVAFYWKCSNLENHYLKVVKYLWKHSWYDWLLVKCYD